jgi:hypothetical protein
MRPVEDAIESRRETLLLRAIDSYESRHGTDPTVRELAADLGIPPDFGHSQLVERLRREVSAGFVSHYRGRISLTAAGQETVEGDKTFRLLPPSQPAPCEQHTLSEASPA